MKRKRSSDRELGIENQSKLLKTDAHLKSDEKINALLKEVKLNPKKQTEIRDFLVKLQKLLISDDVEAEFKSSNLDRLKKAIPSFSCKEAFRFMTPLAVSEIGSFRLGTCVKMGLAVDVAVIMPKNCLDQKDYLNQRYLYKRAVYLAHLASYLSKKKNKNLVESVRLRFERGIHVRPQLIIKPAEALGQHFVVCLHVQMEKDSFKWSRFHMNVNNLRPKPYRHCEKEDLRADDDYPATPHYNSWVLLDLTSEVQMQRLERALEGHDAIKDAIILLKIWLHQRQLDEGFGGFSGFIMTSFVVYLLSKGKLSELAFGYQVFLNTLSVLAQSDWSVSGISMATGSEDDLTAKLSEFHLRFEVVFIDSSGCLNLCADMSKSTFDCVRQEAKLSVKMMEALGSSSDAFESLWMTTVPFVRKYDEIFHINFEGHMKKCAEPKKRGNDAVTDFCGNFLAYYLPRIVGRLKTALDQRISLLAVKQTILPSWSLNESPPLLETSHMFGVLLEKEQCYRTVDRGPIGNSPEAVEFQKMWGKKAELWRFPDGAICESVHWPSVTLADKRTIVKRIIRHIMLLHTSVVADDMVFYTNSLDRFLYLPLTLLKRNSICYATGEEEHLNVILSFDALSKEIQSIHDLPLQIESVRGISHVFCYSEVFPPLPRVTECNSAVDGNRLIPVINEACPPFTSSIKVLCMLERSGKWPADRDICEALKMSFLARLKQSLESKFGLMSVLNKDSLCVFKDGYVFRLLIGFTHEITMSRMASKPDAAVTAAAIKVKDGKDARALERLISAMPRMISLIHGVQTQNSSFSCVCRLTKRWLASHMLLDDFYLDELALQIIVASLYVNPCPFQPPCSPLVGFLRFLHLMATHDWATVPLIVNFNDELKDGDYEEILTKFYKERRTLPLMFLATPVDKFSQLFSKKCPTAHILTRIATIAHESLSILQNQLESFEEKFDPKIVFQPQSKVFDVIIHLKPEVCSRAHLALEVGPLLNVPKYSVSSCQDKIPVYDYDLVIMFLHQLRAEFDEFALFFYDLFGGKYIGVVWKPTAFQPVPITSSHVAHRTVAINDNEEVQMVPNVPCILKEFEQLSPRCIESIEVRQLLPPGSQIASASS